jgi:hypothetical protein
MARGNVEAAREFTALFNAHDIDGLVRRAAPDIVIVAQRPAIEGALVGHEGVRRWAQGYFDTAPDAQVEIDEIAELDDGRLLVLGRQFGTGPGGGVPFEAPLAVIADHDDDGRLRRYQAFASVEEARAAASGDAP